VIGSQGATISPLDDPQSSALFACLCELVDQPSEARPRASRTFLPRKEQPARRALAKRLPARTSLMLTFARSEAECKCLDLENAIRHSLTFFWHPHQRMRSRRLCASPT
jgi:hypothetical protein